MIPPFLLGCYVPCPLDPLGWVVAHSSGNLFCSGKEECPHVGPGVPQEERSSFPMSKQVDLQRAGSIHGACVAISVAELCFILQDFGQAPEGSTVPEHCLWDCHTTALILMFISQFQLPVLEHQLTVCAISAEATRLHAAISARR